MSNQQIQEDLAFATDKRDMVLLEAPRGARAMVYTVILFFTVLLVWAFIAKIDEVRKGEGVAVPIQQIQEIQNLEGGILKTLNTDLLSKLLELGLFEGLDLAFNVSRSKESCLYFISDFGNTLTVAGAAVVGPHIQNVTKQWE